MRRANCSTLRRSVCCSMKVLPFCLHLGTWSRYTACEELGGDTASYFLRLQRSTDHVSTPVRKIIYRVSYVTHKGSCESAGAYTVAVCMRFSSEV